MMEFLVLDKYAAHVWTVYGLSVLLIVGNIWLARAQFKSAKVKALRRVQAREQKEGASK